MRIVRLFVGKNAGALQDSLFMQRLRLTIVLVFLFGYCVGQGRDGIVFIENKGQWGGETKFAADVPGGKLFLMGNKLSYSFTNVLDPIDAKSTSKSHIHAVRSKVFSVLDVEFAGSNLKPSISAYKKRPESYNFYLNSVRDNWGEDCQAFEVIQYDDLYDGIDLVLYSQNKNMKYDLVVDKNADASQINFNYVGDINMFLEDGCSFIQLGSNTIMENRPVAYQIAANGEKKMVDCQYQLSGKQLSFRLGADYDPELSLVIDPELIFSTFSGSVSDNFGYTACFDDAGNLYSGGIVFGAQFPSTTGQTFSGGATDMAILKYDSSGSNLIYATFIGGDSGDTPHSLIVNNNNELVIMGTTGSSNYPTSAGAYDASFNGGTQFTLFESFDNGSDIVVSKLNQSGQLIASTYIGGSGNDGVLKMLSVGDYINKLIYNYGDYQRGDVIVDENDNVYVASNTDFGDFPIVGNIQSAYAGGNSDAVVFSLNSSLSELKWSTYLGGSDDDATHSIKLNDAGHVLVGGGTASFDFPTSAGALNQAHQGGIDGFITTIDAENDSIAHSTFLGTPNYDQVYFIDIDENQNIYATGQTTGAYPVSDGVYSNPNSAQFIHKLDSKLGTTEFSTVIGSGVLAPNISPTAFLVNECDNIYLSGWGGNTNTNNQPGSNLSNTFGLPVTSSALFSETDGSDFYLMALSSDASELLYATFFGSTNNGGDHVDGGTSRFDKRGIVYQSVCSCGGSVDDFPTTPGSWSQVNQGIVADGTERCNNAAFKFDIASLLARFETNNLEGTANGLSEGCVPLSIVFTNTGIGGEEFFWDFGDGTSSSDPMSITKVFESPGEYEVVLTVRDENTCRVEDAFSTRIRAFQEPTSVSGPVEICEGNGIQLIASGGGLYRWSPSTGLDDNDVAMPYASPAVSTNYTVEITTPNGCVEEREVAVTVVPTLTEDFEVVPRLSCGGDISYEFIDYTSYSGPATWAFGDGEVSTEERPIHVYENPGNYEVNLEIEALCLVDRTVVIEVSDIFVPNIFTPNGDGVNDFLVIRSPFDVSITILNRNGKEVYKSNNYQNDWDGDNLGSGVYYYQVNFSDIEQCKGWLQITR